MLLLRRRGYLFCSSGLETTALRFSRIGNDVDEQDHWSERGRAASVANLDAPGRPRRSILVMHDEVR